MKNTREKQHGFGRRCFPVGMLIFVLCAALLFGTTAVADSGKHWEEQQANFRMVTTTGMGKGRLYRSSSPVNPDTGRNRFADDAMARAGVETIVNLADDKTDLRFYEGYYTSYYTMTEHIEVNMKMDVHEEDFEQKFAKGLRFMIENPGIYAIHCKEGKDRTGFTVAVLECLMGASWQEVAADYMQTFINYYGWTPESKSYQDTMEQGIMQPLAKAFGVRSIREANLKEEAKEYLREIGLTKKEIEELHICLAASATPNATRFVKLRLQWIDEFERMRDNWRKIGA